MSKTSNMILNKKSNLPSGWKIVKLGDVIIEIADGGTPSTCVEEYFNGEIPWVNIEDIKPKIVDTRRKITRLGLENSSAKLWPRGTVIFSFGASIGKVGIAEVELATKQGIAGIVVDPKILNNRFLYYVLLKISPLIQEIGKGMGSTVKEVRPAKLTNLINFFLPPLSTQQKIVKILDAIQEGVEVQEKIIEKTKELKKSLMADLFRLGGPGFRRGRKLKKTEIGEIPEDWEVVKLKEVCNRTQQGDPSKEPEKTIKYVDVSSIDNKIFKIIDYKIFNGRNAPSRARKVVEVNDIIFATVRPYLKRIAIVPQELDREYCSTAFCVIRANKEFLIANFIFNYLITDSFINRVSGFQSGTGYPAISDNHILNEKIPLPSLPEQQEIAEILQTIDQKIEIEQKKKALYEELFKAMLQKLMTAEIKVDNINLE